MHNKIKVYIKILGILTLIEGIFMLACTLVACNFKEWNTANGFFTIGVICCCIGFVTLTQLRFDKIHLKSHEGFFVSFICWVYCSILASLPFYFSGNDYSFISCFFEASAGFSTTGCFVFDINLLPKSLILWQATCNWLGGMGILILVVSIFPALGINGQSIASAEATGPTIEKIGGKFSDTGKILYTIYVAFSVVEFLLLWAGPFGWYDALVNTFTSISTAGLVVTKSNIDYFSSLHVRSIVLIFTLLSSLNYTLFFFMVKRNFKPIKKNIEVKVLGLIIIVSTLLIALSLRISGTYTSMWQAIQDGLCQVVSFVSTSGYFVCDYTKWPTFTIVILFSLLFVGGCSMSTSGSLKVIRIIVFMKLIKRGIFKQVHPNSVKAVVVEGKAVPANKVSNITTHIILYFAIIFLSILILSMDNFDMETTITTVLGLFSNTGLALGEVGCSGYFGMYSQLSQLYMSFLMIAGRLEIYAVLLVFTRTFWKVDLAKSV